MKFRNLFHIMLIIFLTINGCNSDEKPQVLVRGMQMRLTADSNGIELYNIPEYVIDEFRIDSLDEEQWKNFFAVYEETVDPELRDLQPALNGSYDVAKDLIQFKPETAFRKGVSYFARCYMKKLLQDPQDIISKRRLSSSEGFIEYKFRIED